MKLGFTEFSFGYAFTENLVRASSTGPVGAPVFPNLIQEAQLGFDVSMELSGIPLFFQFKLPELMVRETAKEISDYALSELTTPFFRMPLMRRDISNQHQLLIDLENRFCDSVFYVTPLLQNQMQFNSAYCKQRVHTSSVFFSPREIDFLPDDRKHSVAYQETPRCAWFCSEPVTIKPLAFCDISDSLQRRFSDPKSSGDLRETVKTVKNLVFDFLPEVLRDQEETIRSKLSPMRSVTRVIRALGEGAMEVVETLVVTRELARIGLGIDMVFAQPRRAE